MFSIKKKQISSHLLSIKLPAAAGTCHVDNFFYVAGGEGKKYYVTYFNKFCCHGGFTQLERMSKSKSSFPLTYWKRERCFFTLGGYASESLKETTKYSVAKASWENFTELPYAIDASSATILNNVLINIGGFNCNHSLLCYHLLEVNPAWKEVKVIGCDFEGYTFGDATVVGSQIIYFGT